MRDIRPVRYIKGEFTVEATTLGEASSVAVREVGTLFPPGETVEVRWSVEVFQEAGEPRRRFIFSWEQQ